VVGFHNNEKGPTQEYYLPVHDAMKLVTFTLEANGVNQACFEWTMDRDDPSRVGCHMNLEHKEAFKHLICLLINETAT